MIIFYVPLQAIPAEVYPALAALAIKPQGDAHNIICNN